MSELPLETNLARIFLEDVPLIDLRAPVEFKEGAFPMNTTSAFVRIPSVPENTCNVTSSPIIFTT